MASSTSIDSSVIDFFSAAIEAIITERKASIVPLPSANLIQNPTLPYNSKPNDVAEYIRQSLSYHKRDLQKPLFMDIYLYHPAMFRYIHIERWCLTYTLNSSSDRDNRPIPVIVRRLHILQRSIYCFVRLLPGFNLLHLPTPQTQGQPSRHTQTHSPPPAIKPSIAFELHYERDMPVSFPSPPSSYTFPVPSGGLTGGRGGLGVKVWFAASAVVEEVLRGVYGISEGLGDGNSNAIPIPSSSANKPPTPKHAPIHSTPPTSVPILIPGSHTSSNSGNSLGGLGVASDRVAGAGSYDSRGNRISFDNSNSHQANRRHSHSEKIHSSSQPQQYGTPSHTHTSAQDPPLSSSPHPHGMLAQQVSHASSVPTHMTYNYPPSSVKDMVNPTVGQYTFIYPAQPSQQAYNASSTQTAPSQYGYVNYPSPNPSPSTSFTHTASMPIPIQRNTQTPQTHSQGNSWNSTPPFLANLMAANSPGDTSFGQAGQLPHPYPGTTPPSPPDTPPMSSSPLTSFQLLAAHPSSSMNIKQTYMLMRASSGAGGAGDRAWVAATAPANTSATAAGANATAGGREGGHSASHNQQNTGSASTPGSFNESPTLLQHSTQSAHAQSLSLALAHTYYHIIPSLEEVKMRLSVPNSHTVMPIHILQQYVQAIYSKYPALPGEEGAVVNHLQDNPLVVVRADAWLLLKKIVVDLRSAKVRKLLSMGVADAQADVEVEEDLSLDAILQIERERRYAIAIDSGSMSAAPRRVSFEGAGNANAAGPSDYRGSEGRVSSGDMVYGDDDDDDDDTFLPFAMTISKLSAPAMSSALAHHAHANRSASSAGSAGAGGVGSSIGLADIHQHFSTQLANYQAFLSDSK